MTTVFQLDFFEDPIQTELKSVRKEIADTKTSQERCRKAQFSRIGEIKKEYIDLKVRLENIERGLCQNIVIIQEKK